MFSLKYKRLEMSMPRTDSIKINCPGHNIRIKWPNFWHRSCRTKYFWKNSYRSFYSSFDTFCVQIGQLFAEKRIFGHLEEFRSRRQFPSIAAICRFSNILQRLTITRSSNWPICTQKVPNEALLNGLQMLLIFCFRIIFWTGTAVRQIFKYTYGVR